MQLLPKLHEKALEVQKKMNINNVNFHHNDFHNHSIKGYDVVFINPDTPMERGIEKKMLNELNGKLIVHSNHFHPVNLKKESSFRIENTLIGVYSK